MILRDRRIGRAARAWCVVFCAATGALPVSAQTRDYVAAAEAHGGVVRVLDKMTGAVTDLNLGRGQAQTLGRLTVLLDECRYPADDPASDAFIHLTLTDDLQKSVIFSGWMVASSPALSALDHPRYDVWALHCDTPGLRPPVQERADTGEDDPTDDAATEGGSAQ